MQNSSWKLVPNSIFYGAQEGEYLSEQSRWVSENSIKPFEELTNLPIELALRKEPLVIPRLKQPTQLFWSVYDSEGEESPPQFTEKGLFSPINPQITHRLQEMSRSPQFLFEYHESSEEEHISQGKKQCEEKSDSVEECRSTAGESPHGGGESHFSNNIIVNRFSMMISKAQITKCLLRRDRRNRDGNIEFNIYDANTLLHLLTVTKSQQGLSFCLKRKNESMKPIYQEIALMKTNLFGKKFTLLERDENGTAKGSLLTICYDSSFFGLNSGRTFTVYIPREPIPKEYLNDHYTGDNMGKIHRFMSKPLNSYSEGIQKSVKNFTLAVDQAEELPDEPNLLFRKLQEDVFSLDVGKKFSLVQAAGVAVSTFDINCP